LSRILFILITVALWVLITIYWVISSRRVPANHRGNEIMSFVKLVGSSFIMYVPLLTGGLLATSLFETSLATEITGTMICLAGILVMVRAREHLGRNWSGNVIIQQEHSLIKNGPYRLVRHPIYSGGLCAMLGSAIVLGQIFAFAWALFCTFGLVMKSKQEEALLSNQFPEDILNIKRR